ncbi:MAG: dockerin type I domain-containing protein [Planctomycetota bacterium]
MYSVVLSRSHASAAILVWTVLLLLAQPVKGGDFVRSDVNDSQAIDLGDAFAILNYLTVGAPIQCEDAADINDDGVIDVVDPLHLLHWLFNGGPGPMAPFPACGSDPSPDALTCVATSCP